MIRLRFSGNPKWASVLAKKYGVSKSAIFEDWRRRAQWIEDLNGGILEDAVDVCKENLLEMKKCREEAWRFYHNAANDNAKVGALNLINKSAKDHIKVLQGLGSLAKELGRLETDTPAEDLITVNITPMEDENENE